METLISLAIGLGLSAACGFRIFVPLLVMSAAARAGYLTLDGGFEWIGSLPALVAFATATVLEIGAYYVPFLDNLLDTLAVPSATVAGTVVAASQVTDFHPMLGWTLAVIAGGGAAGLIQGLTAVTRQFSSVATAGFGNPLLSTLEAGAALVFSVLAIVVPLVAAAGVLILLYLAVTKVAQRVTLLRAS